MKERSATVLVDQVMGHWIRPQHVSPVLTPPPFKSGAPTFEKTDVDVLGFQYESVNFGAEKCLLVSIV